MSYSAEGLPEGLVLDAKLGRISGTTPKAGDYKVEVEGDKAVIHDGKNVVEAAVKVESTAAKITETQVISNGTPDSGAPMQVEAIRIGGSHIILHFEK